MKLFSILVLIPASLSAQTFEYNPIGRLLIHNSSGLKIQFDYDPAGNIASFHTSTIVALKALAPMPIQQTSELFVVEFNLDVTGIGAMEISVGGLPSGIEILNPSSIEPDGTPRILVSPELGSPTTPVKLQFRSSVSPPPEFTPLLSVVTSSVPVPANPDLSISGLRMMEDGKVRVEFTCVPNKRYIVQSSADLKTWTNVSEAMEATGPTLVWEGIVEEAGTEPSKNGFYRVIQVQ
jgi:hypothetical protein